VNWFPISDGKKYLPSRSEQIKRLPEESHGVSQVFGANGRERGLIEHDLIHVGVTRGLANLEAVDIMHASRAVMPAAPDTLAMAGKQPSKGARH